VEAREHLEEHLRQASSERLRDVLYANQGKPLVPEGEWVNLVRRVAAQDAHALHALYDRAHRIVFTLAVRITGDRESAEEVTLDVFLDVWRRAGAYDPANGTVLGWIMNQARSRAIDRLRFEQRKKRRSPDGIGPPQEADEDADPGRIVEIEQQARALRSALAALPPQERQVIECAFLSGLTHPEVALRLGQPLGTVKTRIRSGLQKLRLALGTGSGAP
jgi:RNA polymerase sigma-70 factor (ECF subfamily)